MDSVENDVLAQGLLRRGEMVHGKAVAHDRGPLTLPNARVVLNEEPSSRRTNGKHAEEVIRDQLVVCTRRAFAWELQNGFSKCGSRKERGFTAGGRAQPVIGRVGDLPRLIERSFCGLNRNQFLRVRNRKPGQDGTIKQLKDGKIGANSQSKRKQNGGGKAR